jgi:tRNA (cytidine/uridine-2'-O-)-methyltransferase
MPDGPKLRCPAVQPPFSVVLVEPEIPPNTGSVARTCVATSSPLHLCKPLGFHLDDRSLKRAGIDYWHLLNLHVHESFDAFLRANPQTRLHLFTGSASRSFLDVAFAPGDALVFGRESVGLDTALLARHRERCVAIPTSGDVRSLNLSNAVSVALYEALRQVGGLQPADLA